MQFCITRVIDRFTALHRIRYGACINFTTIGIIVLTNPMGYDRMQGKGGEVMKKQDLLPGFELVDLKVRLERDKREKLAILSKIHRKSMNQFVYELIDNAITNSQELKVLEQVKEQ